MSGVQGDYSHIQTLRHQTDTTSTIGRSSTPALHPPPDAVAHMAMSSHEGGATTSDRSISASLGLALLHAIEQGGPFEAPAATRAQVQHDAYLLALRVSSTEFSEADETDLEGANDTLREARAACKNRVNVGSDMLGDHEAAVHAITTDSLEDLLRPCREFNLHDLADLGAIGAFMEVADCEKFTGLAMAIHASQGRMQHGLRTYEA